MTDKSKNAVFGAAILRLYFVSEISILFFFFRVKFVVYSSLLKLWYENLLHLCRNLEIWSGNYRAVTWGICSDPLILSVGLVLSLYIVTVVSWCPRRLFPGFLLVPLQILKSEDAQVPYSQPSVSTYAEPMDMEGQLYINKCVWISHWKA